MLYFFAHSGVFDFVSRFPVFDLCCCLRDDAAGSSTSGASSGTPFAGFTSVGFAGRLGLGVMPRFVLPAAVSAVALLQRRPVCCS